MLEFVLISACVAIFAVPIFFVGRVVLIAVGGIGVGLFYAVMAGSKAFHGTKTPSGKSHTDDVKAYVAEVKARLEREAELRVTASKPEISNVTRQNAATVAERNDGMEDLRALAAEQRERIAASQRKPPAV